MRIAFFSFEFPEETGGGGIGTYLQQVTALLRVEGHDAIVFTATHKNEAFWENEFTYRLPATNWKDFNSRLPEYFIPIHHQNPFDVAEGTDFHGCGVSVKLKFKKLAFVARLHTPLYLVDKLQYQPLTFTQKLRFVLGGLKRGKFQSLPAAPVKEKFQEEFLLLKMSERISSPSVSIYKELLRLGFDIEGKTEIIPLPFQITEKFLSIKSRPDIYEKPHIVFIGRLEIRKGVIELAKAIPGVLKKFPGTHFTFAGESSFSPIPGKNMKEYLQQLLHPYLNSVTFTGRITAEQVYDYLDKGDIFVFPSHYESFGLACCEAMAAGKAVIASNTGGLSEIVEDHVSGLLVRHSDAQELSMAIERTISDNNMRLSLGIAARRRISEYLEPRKIINAQLMCYQQAIKAVQQN